MDCRKVGGCNPVPNPNDAVLAEPINDELVSYK
jgi:hypothetical protein